MQTDYCASCRKSCYFICLFQIFCIFASLILNYNIMGDLICYLISLMDKSFERNDASMSCANFHHYRLEIVQDILKHISIDDVPSDLVNLFKHYCNVSIDFGHLSS